MTFRFSRRALIFVFTLFSVPPVQALEFKIATLSPDGSFWMQKLREGADTIAEKTNNRVSFKFYPGGAMGDSKTVFRKMQFGQLHGAALTNGSLTTLYPDIQLYNLLLKFQSLEEIDYIRQHMDSELSRGLEEKGLVALGFSEIGFAYLMSKQAIANINDLRHRKVWVPENNNVALAAFNALSVAPIPLPIRDVLVGLQTGMIDVVTGSPIGALALQWHTQIEYVTDLPLSYIFGVLFVDSKTFERLTPQDQAVVKEVMAAIIRQVDGHSREDNINALTAIRNQGIKFVKPEPEAAEQLRLLVDKANLKLVETGKLSTAKIERLNRLLADFRAR